jgi:hypothetical protein
VTVPGELVVIGQLCRDFAGGPEILLGKRSVGGLRRGVEITRGIEMTVREWDLRVQEQSAEEDGQREEDISFWHLRATRTTSPTVNQQRSR